MDNAVNDPKTNQPISRQALDFYWADYTYAPGIRCHVCDPHTHNPHPLCPSWILLDKPLFNSPYGPTIHLTAKAISAQKSCLWWQPWKPSQVIKDLFYSIEITPEAPFYLLFQQSSPNHLISPFRLFVFPITDDFPRPEQFWKLARVIINKLSAFKQKPTL